MSVVGLDVGTSRVKAVRFDATWQAVDESSEETVVLRGEGGRREQDMADVWQAASRVLAAVTSRSADQVDLVAITAQGDGCWLVDATGVPAGNALLWNDARATDVVAGWRADGTLDAAFRISGCWGAPGLANAQLVWLREFEPERLRRAARLLSCGSWVFACLTGREVLERSDAANPFCSARTGEYDAGLIELFELTDLAGLLPPVVSDADCLAPIRPDVAARLGLPRDTTIALAPYDVVTSAVGSGACAVDDGFAVLGTTLCAGMVTTDPLLGRPANGMTLPGASPETWFIAYATLNGTEVLDWLTTLLGLPDTVAVARLAESSTRADLPLMLPYLSPSGERSPFLDAGIRGSFLGLDLAHGPADVARATFDGLTLTVLDCLCAAGTPRTLAVSGGGARSQMWCQAICDAVGVPVVRPDTPEVGARGAALVAATSLGRFASIEQAVGTAVRPGQTLSPRPDQHARYQERYAALVRARQH